MGVTLAELRLLCKNTRHSQVGYIGWQKLLQRSTGSSYVTSYIKSFILENKFPLSFFKEGTRKWNFDGCYNLICAVPMQSSSN